MPLPKQYKLVLRKERDYFKNARRFFSEYCTYFYQSAKGTVSPSQITATVIVPKKIARLAVERIREKRKIYTALQTTLAETELTGKLVVVAKKNTKQVSLSALTQDIRTMLNYLSQQPL